ncbi:MAG: AbrB/MazE/SpoVT family DNA-binding domain-containing protein [Chloroflexi bacterium]|nr:AbrB/MazE/SpoVT family DNA-binding domain-containing protein [Chloroflexota bacterium]
MSTVTSKGQITIPKHIRETLGLHPGAEVEFAVENGQVILRCRVSPE